MGFEANGLSESFIERAKTGYEAELRAGRKGSTKQES